MRIAFAGTPEFAAAALSALADAGHEVALVLTQPDRPAGRGLKLQASPVKQRALALGAPVAQPRSLRLDGRFPDDAAQARAMLEAARPDVMVVAAYGLILPAWVLALPPLGCINIHASLLPRWRGAAPIHRAIEAGDRDSGITLMQMNEGLDTGDMLLAQAEPIRPDDTTGALHDRLAALGARLIVQALAEPSALRRVPQPAQGITYAHKIDKAEAAVDWAQLAEVIERRVRAFDPFPGASSLLQGQPLKIWRSQIDSNKAPDRAGQGEIWRVDEGKIHVVCGGGSSLCLTEVQRAGGRRQSVAQFLQGHDIKPGMCFEPAGEPV